MMPGPDEPASSNWLSTSAARAWDMGTQRRPVHRHHFLRRRRLTGGIRGFGGLVDVGAYCSDMGVGRFSFRLIRLVWVAFRNCAQSSGFQVCPADGAFGEVPSFSS